MKVWISNSGSVSVHYCILYIQDVYFIVSLRMSAVTECPGVHTHTLYDKATVLWDGTKENPLVKKWHGTIQSNFVNSTAFSLENQAFVCPLYN